MTTRIIGIGASAGGLEALEVFLAEVDRSINAAIVIVQHLSPNYASSMTDILQHATRMPVYSLTKDVEPEPGAVYVKSPLHDVRVTTRGLKMVERTDDKPELYLPIDDFFTSLAQTRKEESVAIVLSGMGTDGSRGIKTVKETGGIVMVQLAETARFDGMPRSALRQNVADVVASPDKLASRVSMIVKSNLVNVEKLEDVRDLSNPDILKTLLRHIRQAGRIDFTEYRKPTIIRRVEKRMLVNQIDDLAEYVSFALDNELELLTLRQSFLIGVTRFFRDTEAFQLFSERIVPVLFSSTEPGAEVRLWVPSCSTGEEAYSYAILIQEYLREQKRTVSYKIFGSDVDREAIGTASMGIYDRSIVADVRPDLLKRYFNRKDHGYRVQSELKEKILFAVQNLLVDPPFIRVNFLACRNFLIYINSQAQYRLLSNFYFSLNPGGYLFLGPSENLGELASHFQTVDRRWKFFRKISGGVQVPKIGSPFNKPSSGVIGPLPTFTSAVEQSAAFQLTDTVSTSPNNIPVMDHYARYLSDRYAPPALFVDANYGVLYLSGEFDGILQLPRYNAIMSLKTVVSEHIQKMLTSGVDRVLETGTSAVIERVNLARGVGEELILRVRFSSILFEHRDGPLALLEFLPPHSPLPDTVQDEELSRYLEDRFQDRIKQLESQLHRSEQRAQKLYNELEATNEELQASNRELLASNEEMQSTNEELQSVNEELYTVNGELQRKNDELYDINNDVNNLLKSTQISTIFIDNRLRIRRFTPGIGQQFDLQNSDLGRPITSFATPFKNLDIELICRKVLETNTRYDEELNDGNNDFYLLRVLPYLTDERTVEGVVITFVDVSDLVKTRKQLTGLANKYRAIFDYASEVIAVLKQNSQIVELNQAIGELSEISLVGSYFSDLIASDTEKVSFDEALRSAFEGQTVGSLELTLTTPAQAALEVQLEIIPIQQSSTADGERQTVENAVILLHDVTGLEKERTTTSAIISRYQKLLADVELSAGLIDMDATITMINRRGMFEEGGERYLSRNLSEFLTPKGMEKYAEALLKIRKGAGEAEVSYRLEELTDDDQPRRVIYRPVKVKEELIFVTFEVIG